MTIFKRAFLYITRKKARSLILFTIVFVMAIFMLIGISIHSSALNAAENVKKSVQTGISLRLDVADAEETFDFHKNADGEIERTLKIPILTQSKLQKILKIKGVSGYFEESNIFAFYTGLNVHPGGSRDLLEELKAKDLDTLTDEEKETIKGLEASQIYACGFYPVQEAWWQPFFLNGALEISEGRNIKSSDRKKAVISEELADRNKLKIGDKLTISSFNYITGERYGNTLELEIVGIFQMNFEEQVSKYTTESDIISNLIFTDEEEFTNWWTGEWNEYYNEDPIVPLEDPVVTYVTLYVDDPGMLKEVEDEIRGIDDKIDWEYYNFEYYDKDYKAIAKPLLLMVKLSTALMIIMAVGALVILSFILSMWIQGRKKEIHILSLIGIKKRSILAQIVLECSLVSICAFILAGAAAGPITDAVGKGVEKSVSSIQSDQPYETSRNVNGEVEIYRTSNEPVMLEYNLTLVMAVKVLAVMLAVIILSVLISFMRIEGRGRGKIRIHGF